jgi:hypothetical protein
MGGPAWLLSGANARGYGSCFAGGMRQFSDDSTFSITEVRKATFPKNTSGHSLRPQWLYACC